MISENRKQELKAEVTTLKARLGEIEAELDGKPPAPQAPLHPRAEKPDGATVTTLLNPVNASLMPDEKQLRSLHRIVLAAYPNLQFRPERAGYLYRANEDDDPDGFKDFCAAFGCLLSIGRTQTPSKQYSVGWFLDAANEWLDARGQPRIRKGLAFLAACIAVGDVPFVVGVENEGVLWELGLQIYGGRPATDSWKKVIAGQLPKPVSSGRPLREIPQVRIRYPG
ncbi:MAG: hypothetical protein WA268_15440 [Xanthobacteraceae bacterium]